MTRQFSDKLMKARLIVEAKPQSLFPELNHKVNNMSRSV